MNKTESVKKMTIDSITVRVESDFDAEVDYLEMDKERQKAYDNGEFEYIGIYAEAEIIDSNNVVQKVVSDGLWGIESDNEMYVESIKREEIDELTKTLIGDFGFTEAEVEDIEIEDA